MPLRAFIPTVVFTPEGNVHIEGPVFDTGVVVDTPSCGILYEGNATITDVMTPAQIKTALQDSFIAKFNQRTGRQDGSTITFVWL